MPINETAIALQTTNEVTVYTGNMLRHLAEREADAQHLKLVEYRVRVHESGAQLAVILDAGGGHTGVFTVAL